MKLNLLLLFLVSISFQGYTQNNKEKKFSLQIDTLRLSKKQYQDSTQIKNYLDFIFDNFRTETGNSINLTDYLYNRSADIKQQPLMASARNIKASIYALKNDYQNATKYYIEAMLIFQKMNQPYSTAMMCNNLGMMYNNTNNKKLALDYFQKGLIVSEKNKIDKPKALIYINLTNMYITEGNLKEALEAALKANAICEKLKMKKEQAVNANLIGVIYFYQSNYNKAIEFYRLSQNLAKESNDVHSENIAMSNVGEVLALQKNPEAIEVLQAPEKYFTKIKDYVNLQQVFTHYSNYYKNIKSYEKSIDYLDKLRIVDTKINDSIQRKSIQFYQTKFETKQKENKILLLSKSDSIKNLKIGNQQLMLSKNLLELTRQKLMVSGAQLKITSQSQTILQKQLETAQKQQKINYLSKESLQQKLILQEKQIVVNQKNTLIGVILSCVFILMLVGYGIYRKKQLQQKAFLVAEQIKQRELLTQAVIEAEETERKRIASDLHDGVGQLFSAVKMNLSGLLNRMEIKKEEDRFLAEKTMALVDESCKEVRVISHKMMPNFLLKSGIAADIKSFIEKIDEKKLKISFESIGFKEQLEFNEEVILYRVIQELIGNVIKHANANELNISLIKTKENIQVKIVDNGIGFDYEKAIEKGGLGLKNILVRIQYIKGTIQFLKNKPSGSLVQIDIRIN
jgi:two-component system, NarL family, sensor kinase